MTAARALSAQQKAMTVIGFLGSASPGPFAPFVAAFRQPHAPRSCRASSTVVQPRTTRQRMIAPPLYLIGLRAALRSVAMTRFPKFARAGCDGGCIFTYPVAGRGRFSPNDVSSRGRPLVDHRRPGGYRPRRIEAGEQADSGTAQWGRTNHLFQFNNARLALR